MVDIGASEAPAVLGVSPHMTPWELWAIKVGLLADDTEPTELMTWGSRIESTVLRGFLDDVLCCDLKDAITSPDTRRWRQERPWMRATPDAVVLVGSAPALVEVKCVMTVAPEVPRVDWLVQCLHQRLAYPEAERQYLVAFGGLQMRWWSIPLHDRAMERVLREEERFLEMVEKQIPPPVRAADASVLAKAWPITVPEPIRLDADSLGHVRLLAQANEVLKKWTGHKDEAEANIKAAIGEHEVGIAPDGTRVTWKHHLRKEYVVKEQQVRRLTIKPGKENGDERADSDK